MPEVTYSSPTLSDLVSTLLVDQKDDHHFVATQLDNPGHHIAGGHLAGQVLVAASRTAPGRSAHSLHVYYLRAGDSRYPVEIQVDAARDGGTLATRRITARQDGEILLEALGSFSTAVDALDYQEPIPDVPEPLSVPTMAEQLADYADEMGGFWVRDQPFELRYIDPHPRLAKESSEPHPHLRMWWRPTDAIPDDPAAWDVKVRGAPQLAATLAANREAAMLYRKLATLSTDAPISKSLADVEYRGVPRERRAIPRAAFGSTGTPRSRALRSTMRARSSSG